MLPRKPTREEGAPSGLTVGDTNLGRTHPNEPSLGSLFFQTCKILLKVDLVDLLAFFVWLTLEG